MRTASFLAALALSALPSLAAGEAAGSIEAQANGRQPLAAEATRSLAALHASLESATVSAEMLQTLATTPGAWDEASARELATNVSTALAQTRAHVADLRDLELGDDARPNVEALERRLAQAEQLAADVDDRLDTPENLGEDVASLVETLASTREPLRNVARVTGVKLTAPGAS